MTTPINLRACPTCDKSDAAIQSRESGFDLAHFVRCPWCGTATDSFCDAEAARRVWNTRPIEDAANARIAELESALRKTIKGFDHVRYCGKCGNYDAADCPDGGQQAIEAIEAAEKLFRK